MRDALADLPEVDLRDGERVSGEAPLLCSSHTLGTLPPDDVVPIAEARGLIGD